MDIYIGGVRDRNAALHGDVVVVEIKPIDQWKVSAFICEGVKCRTLICIAEKLLYDASLLS